jgi:hypothetical protein
MLGSASNINSYPNVFGIQQGLSAEQLAKTLASSKPKGAADAVTISPSANMMQQLLNMEIQGNGTAENSEVDLTGLAQLKQRGDMLASMLQLKMKNFESNLISGIKGAGLDPAQEINLKEGDDGLNLTDNLQNKEEIQKLLKNGSSLHGEFQDISNMANILEALSQLGPDQNSGLAGVSSAARYAQQSNQVRPLEKRSDAEFVLRVAPGDTSFSFE